MRALGRHRRSRRLALAVLCALAALAVLGAFAAAGTAAEPAPCDEAEYNIEGVHVTKVETLSPSGEWQNRSEAAGGPYCAFASYEDPTDIQVDVASVGPELEVGQRFRVTLESEFKPLYLVGLFRSGQVVYGEHSVVVTGTVGLLSLPYQAGEECLVSEEGAQANWLLFLQLDRGSPAEEAYAGSYFSTNSYPNVPKVVEGGKALSLELSGCGDGDPATADGFFDGFIPDSAAAALGISPELVASLTGAVAGQLVQVTNNGQPTNAGLTLEEVEGGLKLGYSLSYSRHKILIRANHKAIALAHHCQRTHGKLKVERVRHKARHVKLACR